MSLNIFGGQKPPDKFYVDVGALRQISPDKLPFVLDYISTHVLEKRAMPITSFEKLAEKTETTVEIVIGAANAIAYLIRKATLVTKEELADDLQKLKLTNETIDQISNFMETTKTQLYSYAKRSRNEAVPSLVDINWRVDIRHASGDFLKEPTVYVLMRIQGYDGEKMDQIYLELDRDSLSWLETTLKRIKARFVEAEKIKEKMYSLEQS
jgi:hypothetical protein